ncbi:hypothetical protein [Propionispora hippei]|uniref:Butirosin biosynthesis protein H, N-terminal n=1 Tax=Propionispora hippei DSM 15287 TaxID=1123003 RepID=A0A1M6PBF2_9FIRM|nr:hypothetical protein [Propionispora hippei]SHK05299.1 hypothetical protein SAMN02745170_04007 [Propionispora hippei DSM 15287]
MSLIFFQGLNCYSSCLVNAAVFTGADYREVFADLWSETDFTYDQVHRLYLSQRLPKNLASMEVSMRFINCCSGWEIKEKVVGMPMGQLLIVGMDAFFIPWVPFYQTMHSFHYFIARKENEMLFSCFDPTYDKQNLEITEEHLIAYASDICRIDKSVKKTFSVDIRQEAQKILETHPETQEKLLAQIMECSHGKQKNGELLAKYIDALSNNRYLYLHYLQTMPLPGEQCDQCFHKEFFRKWAAVKHGLFKASLNMDNQFLICEVCEYFKELIAEEMSIARKLHDLPTV